MTRYILNNRVANYINSFLFSFFGRRCIIVFYPNGDESFQLTAVLPPIGVRPLLSILLSKVIDCSTFFH